MEIWVVNLWVMTLCSPVACYGSSEEYLLPPSCGSSFLQHRGSSPQGYVTSLRTPQSECQLVVVNIDVRVNLKVKTRELKLLVVYRSI